MSVSRFGHYALTTTATTATTTPSPFMTLLLSHYFLFFWAVLFVLFKYFVTLSSLHPSQETLTRHLGCLGQMCPLPPPPSNVVSSIFKLFKLFSSLPILPAQQPSRATLAHRLDCLGRSARGFFSHLMALVICLTSVVDFAQACLASFLAPVLCASFQVSIYFYFICF